MSSVDAVTIAEPLADRSEARGLEPLTPEEALALVAVGRADALQCVVSLGPSGKPNHHRWPAVGQPFAKFAAGELSGKAGGYFSMAAFEADGAGELHRVKAQAVAVRGLWIDIENTERKAGADDKGYPGAEAVISAVTERVRAGLAIPNMLVETGSGGVHLHWVLDHAIPVEQWAPMARRFVAFLEGLGLKFDAPCTTDAARIMRAPGTIHQGTRKPVVAHRMRRKPYALAELSSRIGFDPTAVDAVDLSRPDVGRDRSVNADILGEAYPAYSYQQAAQKCGAMRKAAEGGGKATGYGPWILAIRAADLASEGRAYAHDISKGHASYNEGDTERKLESMTGGPAGCDAWGDAFGPAGPCASCEWAGTIKNPAIQLGAVPKVAAGYDLLQDAPVATAPGAAKAPEWVEGLNSRFALARIGTDVLVVDFKSPFVTSHGVVARLGYIGQAGFRSLLRGQFAPLDEPGAKPRPLADAWMAHQQRRQYDAVIFAPGDATPTNVLNLWQGFSVEPAEGDVSPWLEVLAALVPDATERAYVLRWLAWKVRNPGGVPDTVLIFTGGKGTGKNSLFEPLLAAFGPHGMLADDPELIAGRFTWHLMSKALAVLDEAVFIGDPRQADRIKSRVTAKTMLYEQKGVDPVQGVNRCAYVMLTNHEHVWQATTDERRAVVLEVGTKLRGNLDFWTRYHTWARTVGPAALLHYLQSLDLAGFNPRAIPKGEALRKQIEQTALRDPAIGWWHRVLSEGCVCYRDGIDRRTELSEGAETEVSCEALRLSYEQSAQARGKAGADWSAASRRMHGWVGDGGPRRVRPMVGGQRERRDVLPPLPALRAAFTAATGVRFTE